MNIINENITIYNDDCFNIFDQIPKGSVDLILTDPPYGNMKGINNKKFLKLGLTQFDWDNSLDFTKIFIDLKNIIRQNGKIVLFSQEPLTSNLVLFKDDCIKFNYKMIWLKDHFANPLMSNKAPVSYFEDICVFSKVYDNLLINPLRKYSKEILEYLNCSSTSINRKLGHRGMEHFFSVNTNQFSLPSEKIYLEFINVYNLNKWNLLKSYEDLVRVNKKYLSVFNKETNIKSNVLNYKKDYSNLHPTQKPILLLEDLIKTYTYEGDTVLDFTAGSFSTAIACINTNRKFIGIEKDSNYVTIGKNRILNHLNDLKLF